MRPVIDIRNVHRIFESEAGCAHILHNVSLAVHPGEFVAITGPSGSGKSTLMNILGCLDKPTAGDYYLQGLNVAELDDDELTEVRALSIGFVFQSFNLLPRLSVIENVMLPLSYTNVPRSQREMRAVHALQAVTLPVDHWDHRISELSGGQMQRVAIARASSTIRPSSWQTSPRETWTRQPGHSSWKPSTSSRSAARPSCSSRTTRALPPRQTEP